MNEKIKNNSLSELEKSNVIILNKQKKIALIVLLLVCFFASIYFAYQDEIKSLFYNFDVITITSKDLTQKMSLMNKDTKYSWINSCPKWYHIPTIYEWVKSLKLWCENHPKCDTEDIITDIDFAGWGCLYCWSDEVVDDFFQDFNIHLNKAFDLGVWFHKEKNLWVKFNHWFVCESLSFSIVGRDKYMSVNYVYPSSDDLDRKRCRDIKPKYVRCFSDENLTQEF